MLLSETEYFEKKVAFITPDWDKNVKAVLVNIFGGITRCDDVANGLLQALEQRPLDVPLVVRLTGTNEDEAREILAEAGITAGSDMDEAVKAAVKAAKS